jgi:hypothetical protein
MDSKAITEKILYLLENEAERNAMRKRAYLFGRDMTWANVAQRYFETFEEARRQNVSQLFAVPVTGVFESRVRDVPELKLDHMQRMTDGTGMLQHAVFNVPNYNEGYTTDDNARALIVSVQLDELKNLATELDLEERTLSLSRDLGRRYLAFLWYAFNPANKRFRNFMGYNRVWLEEIGSEDSHGRSIWALGSVLGRSTDDGLRGMAARLFESSIASALQLTSPRSWAFTLLGTQCYLKRYPGDRAVAYVQSTLAQKLKDTFKHNQTADWPWLEDNVTYCNPIMPQALIQYAQSNGDEEAAQIGLRSLKWLIDIQKSDQGWIMPIGSRGFYTRGGEIAYFDQQPVEVYSMISACIDAYRFTHELSWYHTADLAFEWFLGRNALGIPMYDNVSGGCRDGLHIDRVNENQGAESTLAFIQSLLELEQIRAETAITQPSKTPVGASSWVENKHIIR